MSLGLTQKFNILQQSPHDFAPPAEPELNQDGVMSWVPSRFNVRATTEDGRLVLWNSYKGTMSVFGAGQKATIENLLRQRGFEARSQGIVRYLFLRGFIVKRGTNEYRRVQLGFGQQHYRNDVLELILLASEDCNFRCQYCYEDFARGTMQPAVRNGIKNLLLKRLPNLRQLSVSWFGGEPLYGLAAIEDLAPFFMETARENNLQFSSAMTTNGYLLTPDVADRLLSWGIKAYQITLDGPPKNHDHNRPTRDGQGSFAVILENLKALHLRTDDFFVDIRVNFDRGNALHLSELLDILEQEFREDHRFKVRFRAVGQWGGPNDAQLDVCGLEEGAEVQLRMKAEAQKRGLSLSDDIRSLPGIGAQVCYAARPYNYIVGADGKLMKCTIDLNKEDRNVVGHLTEEGDLCVNEDKFALWTEPAFEQDKKCQKCVVLPACQGVFCPQIRIESGKSPCSPLRFTAKKELLAAAQGSAEKARRVAVKKDSIRGIAAEAVAT
jgi:uncharacterized protein